MTFKCFSINMPLSLFTLSDQFPPVQINWANVKEPGTEGVIYTQGKELDDLSIKGQIFFFLNDLTGGKWNYPNQGLNPCHLDWKQSLND